MQQGLALTGGSLFDMMKNYFETRYVYSIRSDHEEAFGPLVEIWRRIRYTE